MVHEFAALLLVSGVDYLSVFDRPHFDALACVFLRLHTRGLEVASVSWGLWLFPFGSLAVRSGLMPRVLGALLWVAGAAYVVKAFLAVLVPLAPPLIGQVAMLLGVGELPIIFWLAFWGAREPRRHASRREPVDG